MSANRREVLSTGLRLASLLLASGALAQHAQAAGTMAGKGAFDAKTVGEVMKSLGLSMPTESKDVSITAPDIAENGAVVPLGAACTLPGVKQVLLMVEKNPAVLAAAFNVTPSIDAAFSTRVKMGQSSQVFAVVVTEDNKVLFAQKEVKVTLGGCGG
ncbi:thiosulfate oxidation carrier protein SoxY [Pelomonas sp. CA6]|uniref:thiosulfate oxidation carrier protein SoxY n=1 Tax=Pelomonas sp. CA6 TaxID=2907999 RepID=UPI001F4BC207|nr:thiosulfate oxidation carrier protein SoxY [Pelomonas sp. CA6]MCH7342279.1 thiosulfate oxidation carrier protein SoxY [Pelomonas sp. CA6]